MDIAPARGGDAECTVRLLCHDMLACGVLLEVLSLLITAVIKLEPMGTTATLTRTMGTERRSTIK